MRIFDRIGQRDKTFKTQSAEYKEGKDKFCPFCNYGPFDGLTGIEYAEEGQHTPKLVPRPNDVTLCVKCYEILQFDEKLNIVPITEEAWNCLEKDEQALIEQICKAKGKSNDDA